MADEFQIEVRPDGTCDVTLNRRAYHYDFADLDEALQHIRRGHGRGVSVIIIEPDGYRQKALT